MKPHPYLSLFTASPKLAGYTMLRRTVFFIVIICLSCSGWVRAQHRLYPSVFDLQEVTLLDGPFKQSQDLNYSILSEYDVDRLLTPYIRQAGLSMTRDQHSPYYQWEHRFPAFPSFAWSSLSLDGHILSHYLSALSVSYASCHDVELRADFLRRIDHILTVLNDCQEVYAHDKNGLKGFIGGVPDNQIWTSLYEGDFRTFIKRGNWVPFYTEQKVLASLRDAYLYTGDERAKEMYRKMCDWVCDLVGRFTNDVMEMQILTWETSSMNEVLADASVLLGDSKYLRFAQRFSHQIRIENMNADNQHDFLDQKHANDMSAMFAGIHRVGVLRKDNRYLNSAHRYWEDFVERRSVANGGAGIYSYFVAADKGASIIKDADGPEFCTTYYMLSLTKGLFLHQRNAKYMDYYEKALLNHILASQDPKTGGTAYYTSMRPDSYRIYSTINRSMWCCSGTGIESYSRYGDFIYTFSQDTLFVNLFIASELNNQRFGLSQETQFPYGTTSRITIKKPGNYQLAVRHPGWATTGYSVTVNGKVPRGFKAASIKTGEASYIACGKNWKEGDVIEITYPMTLTFEYCPNYPDYIALRYGPSLLAAQTSQSEHPEEPFYDPLPHEYGGEGQSDHMPSVRVEQHPLAYAPMLISELRDVPRKISLVDSATLTFSVDATAVGSPWTKMRMMPFYALHHSRYSVYWNCQTEEAWMHNPLYRDQLRALEVQKVTYDEVEPGNKESEQPHDIHISETGGSRGMFNGKSFRDAQPGQWFEYTLSLEKGLDEVEAGHDVAVLCRLSLTDKGRSMKVYANGQMLRHYQVPALKSGAGKDRFYDEIFVVPGSLINGKHSVVVRFSSDDGSFVPRIYQVRVMKNDSSLF